MAGEPSQTLRGRSSRSTPASRPRQPRTNKRTCGIQPAHQSLITDVFGPRLRHCTIHPKHHTPHRKVRRRQRTSGVLDLGHQSVLTHLFGTLDCWRAWRARAFLASMVSALAVHLKVFGLLLRAAIQASMAASSSATLLKTPRRVRWRVISADRRSTRRAQASIT
jgi:hypothetical protein